MNTIECARLESTFGEPVMFEGVKATGDLKGLMFEASVEQRFCNPTDKNVEVVYWRHERITLRPINLDFKSIILTGTDEGQLQVIAELVEVL
jgi:hypothetical protein